MEDPLLPPLRNSKKRLFAETSSSSSSLPIFDDDIVEIPPPSTWKSKSSKQKSIVGHEIIVVDDEDPEDVVIIDEKVASIDKGKKPMLSYFAGHEFITIDGAPSPQANRTKARRQASAASEKHAATPSNSSLFGTQMYSNVSGKVDHFRSESSLKSLQVRARFRDLIGLKPLSITLPGTSSHVRTSSMIQSIPKMPSAFTPMDSATLSGAFMLHSDGSAYAQPSQNFFHGNQNPIVTSINLPSEFLIGNNVRIEDGLSAEISPPSIDGKDNSIQSSILKKLEVFKKFDTLGDHSDHFYDKTKASCKPSKGWANKIADEWRMLEKDLPDTIYVRVYEARMDLLRAVLMGADGTPYHDGLFFFDVHFPASYPNNPPLVNYRAHGLRINPNLYNCGKVCLSLLGTWSGSGEENWRPGKSNMLQVLLSIQGLVLNADPYFNEPGYAGSRHTTSGKKASKNYTENAFLLSLKTMLCTMRNPPKHFEDFVNGHFYKHAHDILAACRAYLDGVEVGSYIKGKTNAVQGNRNTCSQSLRSNLPSYIKSLVEAFTKIGVKDCEKYLISADKAPDCLPTRGRPSTSRKSKR